MDSSWISHFPLVKYVSTKVKNALISILQAGPIPKHIALIMDGNRRYAKQRKWETSEGHSAGFETLSSVLDFCYTAGIECVTVFAFSIENFKRPKREVNNLMDIAKSRLIQICENGDLAEKYGIRIKIIGNIGLLPKDVREVADQVMDTTRNNNKVTLNICFPYTSSDDIAHSMQTIVSMVKDKKLNIGDITETLFDEHLYTGDCPPVDILIRTSGIERLSNFMIWQCNERSTIVFISQLWPEFSFRHLYMIILRWGFALSTAQFTVSASANENSLDGIYSDSSTLDESEGETEEMQKNK